MGEMFEGIELINVNGGFGDQYTIPRNYRDFDGVWDEINGRCIYDSPEIKINEGDIVFDFGACWGGFSIRAAKAFNCGHIYSVEADPVCCEVIKRNIARYGASDKSTLIPRAIFSHNQGIKLVTDYRCSFFVESIFPAREKADGTVISIPSITIDEIVKNEKVDRVDFFKFDIEGSEYDALLGGKETIMKYKPKMAVSVYHRPQDQEIITKLLKQYRSDYNFRIVDGPCPIMHCW
jgi:FkbM family methyltransferase